MVVVVINSVGSCLSSLLWSLICFVMFPCCVCVGLLIWYVIAFFGW